MFCRKCGSQSNENSQICSDCGTLLGSGGPEFTQQVEKTLRNTPKKKCTPYLFGIISWALLALIIITLIFIWPSNKMEGNGFNTPEDAVEAYLIALRDCDTEKMIATFAVESFVENYNFQNIIERTQVYQPSFTQPIPTTNDFTTELNRLSRVNSINQSFIYQYLFFADTGADYENPIYFENLNSSDITEFVNKLGSQEHIETMKSVELTGFLNPSKLSDMYLTQANLENLKKQATIYGAEEMENVVAEVTVNGQAYLYFMQVALFDGQWFNLQVSGNIGALEGIPLFDAGWMLVEE